MPADDEPPPLLTEDPDMDALLAQNPTIPGDYLYPDDSTQLPAQEPDAEVLDDCITDHNIQSPGLGTSTDKSDEPTIVSAPDTIEPSKNIELDEDILEILGDDPISAVKRGPETRKEIASRFQHIATEGLSRECRKELTNKYPLPANCLHVGAPSINPEIRAALNESTLKRDKGIESKQKELASAISCLTELISLHLTSKEKNNTVLQKLMDVGRILCDIQHGDSVTRRNFILFAVKCDMQEHLKSTKIDTSLFGEQLSDTIKSAKAVNKSGADLKADSSKTIQPKKTKPTTSQALNRKAAPPRRPMGAAQYAPRSREYTVPRAPHPPPPPHAPAYRMSSTQQQPPPPTLARRRF